MALLQRVRSFVRERGGFFNIASLFVRKVRSNGLIATAVQAHQLVYRGGGASYAVSFDHWYKKHQLGSNSDAKSLFLSPSVLIIGAMDLPQCRKYRMAQKLEILKTKNIHASMAHYLDSPRVFDRMQLSTHIIFYRTPATNITQAYVREAKRLGLAVGYDIDDPIFDQSTYSRNPNLASLEHKERRNLLRSSKGYKAAMQEVDFVTVSTAGMAALAAQHCPAPVYVWPNLLDGETLSIASELGTSARMPEQACTIAYMSGSRAHDKDFELVVDALVEILQSFPDTRLLLGGYFNLPEKLATYHQRITTFPFTGYAGYLGQLKHADINIVPLVNDGFNECKSAIRFLEAAALGVPTVASAVGDFSLHIKHGETGFLADSEKQWREQLENLITNSSLRQRIGDAASTCVSLEFSVHRLPPSIGSCLHSLGLMELDP